ncbi:crosslink repair DNA glycosylase YcaQ family protein [Streptomyces roseoverticillatus]|uniref:DNA glycosylase AlkZ-like family protein n=1 Tax=Streptomyces roseoverticillatus TaxID=66429 RepID=UPI0033C5520C
MHAPTTAAIDAALYDTGDLARIRCMRRTMFVLPAALAPAVRAATVKDAHRNRGDAQRKLCQELGWEAARYAVSAFGPVTAGDLKWWTGWTLTDTRKALAATGAQEVALDEGTDRPPPPGRPRPWGPYRHAHRGRSPDRLPRRNPCHPLLSHPTGTPAVFRASHKRLTGSAGCGAEGCPTF